ncbi:response regulator [cf. Phormidesmis sp. LEGE 11477]|uniref:hybrid sensor histidine kinase/response regulator n=1 Tax=cf. Phormidesmis sp. LEGE 11477 TaxID=1828680 RepID=UPI00187E4B78|nr:response regulator [cf. Phormidesmis sp. LEGE 11477]MBE9061018.1 response regulator [cf. Phormidesmis sp. LEGE 11477]
MDQLSTGFERLRFLLLEDDAADAELISTLLTKAQMDCEFTRVETESEFRSILESEHISLILADYSLPTFDGLSAIKIAQDIRPDIPCILVSAVLGEERAVEALKAGATDYIVKQRLELLAPAVERAVREQEERQALRLATLEREESEKRFHTLTQTMADPLAVVVANREDGIVRDFTITYLNKAACNYLSISVEEAIDKSIYAAVPAFRDAKVGEGNIDFLNQLSSVLVTGRPLEKEVILEGHESVAQKVVIDLRAAKLNDGLVLTWRDVTEKYQTAQQRQQLLAEAEAARNEAEQANQFKDDFLSTVSHELRSPLSVIKGWVGLTEVQPEADMVPKAFKVIEKNTVLLENLIEDLLDVSRIRKGKLSFTPELLSFEQIGQIVACAIEALSIVAITKQLQISFHTQSLPIRAGSMTSKEEKSSEEIADKPPSLEGDLLSNYVMADGVRLQQVIRNLLSNAIKFTPEKGSIDISLSGEEDTLSISVKDTGKGLKETEIPHLFERFWQARDTPSEKSQRTKGLGIGLSISHYIMGLHYGSIRAQSAGVGKGSTFTIELPTLSSEAMSVLYSQEESSNTPSELGISDQRSQERDDSLLQGVKVLVVEDYIDALDMYKLMLETYGAQVSVATTVESAMEAFESCQPDVLVSDISLPDSDGYALLRKIRARRAEDGGDVPAIALTAFIESQYRAKALLAGFQMHIAKPIGLKDIAEVVAQLTQRTPH